MTWVYKVINTELKHHKVSVGEFLYESMCLSIAVISDNIEKALQQQNFSQKEDQGQNENSVDP